jgi:chitinase
MRSITLLLALLLTLPARAQSSPKIVAYYPEWAAKSRKFAPADIPADGLTHVIYAFARIDDAGKIAVVDKKTALEQPYPDDDWRPGEPRGTIRQLHLLKKKHPHLKTLVSVGGWTLSGNFSDAAATAQSRDRFARSCADFVARLDFDGVDIDWEFPGGGGVEGNKTRPQDPQNFTLLLAELRARLDDRAKADNRAPYLLTIAAPAGASTYARLELAKIHPHVNWINLMTYDLAGRWSELTAFPAPLYAAPDDPRKDAAKFTVDAAVRAYRAAGVPPEKILLGIPFYGHAWPGVAPANHGLFQKHAKDKIQDAWPYRDLVNKPAARFWHDAAKAPWLYDDKAALMIAYDDPRSIAAKAQYILTEHLGGAMIWEITGDDGTLLPALNDALKSR